MPLDPQAEMLLKQMASAGGPALNTLSPVDARKLTGVMFRVPPGSEEPVHKVENRNIPGPAGEIPIRVYTPAGAGPFPVLVFIHGGGFVLCDLDTHDGACRSLTNEAGCVTVSVDYRLAPEHKFPAAVEDCYAATTWVSDHAKEINGDPKRIAVGGDSAGGNLSAVISMLARDAGKPHIMFQLLIYPATDTARNTESHKNFTDYFLTKDMIEYFYRHYLRGEADAKDPRISIALAKDFRALPPAHIITAEFDPLRDEGEAYGRRLIEAGVSAKVTRYDGMMHAFFSQGDIMDKGRLAVAECADALRKALLV